MAITLKTDREGLAIVDQARVKKNWTALAMAWCDRASVSLSTLKRFRERKAIQKDAFIAICRAVGIENWEQVVSGAAGLSVVQRRYKRSKRVIAEEVLSNLESLDARLEFVAQAFSDDPAEAQAARKKLFDDDDLNLPHTLGRQALSAKPEGAEAFLGSSQYPLKLEANVSIIQIMMEI